MRHDRRQFLKKLMAGAVLSSVEPRGKGLLPQARKFKISCAGWSLHREVFDGKSKQIDLFQVVREELGIEAFELVNTMLEVPTASYVTRLKSEADKYDLSIPLIMVDQEGELGHRDAGERKRAVRNHRKWIVIASDLGCHSIRVNWQGHDGGVETDPDPVLDRNFIDRSVDAFGSLTELGREDGVQIVIENHGGPSSRPELLVELIKAVDSPSLGTLPDFGNFPEGMDRYAAVDKMMPYAKAVSAKCYDFDDRGNETTIDFERMLQIVVDKHGYQGYIGIEYEGKRLPEREGIKACRDLLSRLRI